MFQWLKNLFTRKTKEPEIIPQVVDSTRKIEFAPLMLQHEPLKLDTIQIRQDPLQVTVKQEPLKVEVKNEPLEVNITNEPLQVRVSNEPLEINHKIYLEPLSIKIAIALDNRTIPLDLKINLAERILDTSAGFVEPILTTPTLQEVTIAPRVVPPVVEQVILKSQPTQDKRVVDHTITSSPIIIERPKAAAKVEEKKTFSKVKPVIDDRDITIEEGRTPHLSNIIRRNLNQNLLS